MFALIAGGCILPFPYHLLFLSSCRIAMLLYADNARLPKGVLRALGKIHMYLIHLILEYADSGPATTLYLYGLSHAFAKPHWPINLSAAISEPDLPLGKTFATIIPPPLLF